MVYMDANNVVRSVSVTCGPHLRLQLKQEYDSSTTQGHGIAFGRAGVREKKKRKRKVKKKVQGGLFFLHQAIIVSTTTTSPD
jgi:hypothetical protein